MTASHAAARDGARTALALIVTGVWSIASIAVAATWLVGMTSTVPLLDDSGQPRFGSGAITLIAVMIIALSLAAAGAVFSGFGRRSRTRPRPLALTGLLFGLVAAGAQAALLPLTAIDLIATGTLPSPLGLVWQVLCAITLVAFGHLIRIESRRARGRCERCGGRHRAKPLGGVVADRSPLDRPVPTMAPAAVCVVSAVTLVAVFPWAVVKLGWGFGATLLGVSAEEWRRGADLTTMSGPARTLSELGVDITVVAAAVAMIAAVVLLARLPRWLPAPLLIIPSALAAIPLAGYGFPLLVGGLLGLGGVIRVAPDPIMPGLDLPLIMIFGGLAFAGIGTALAIGTGSLFHRSRPVCRPGTYDEAPRVAVVELPVGPKITGLLAWFTWLGIHIVICSAAATGWSPSPTSPSATRDRARSGSSSAIRCARDRRRTRQLSLNHASQ